MKIELTKFPSHRIILLSCLLVLTGGCLHSQADTVKEPYFIDQTVTYLRGSPDVDSPVVAPLYKADPVELMERKENGWWLVSSVRTHQMGWIKRELLSPHQVQVESFYIAAAKLPLRESPSQESPVRNILLKGEQVKKIGESEEGWLRVLSEKDGSLGWIPGDSISSQPVRPQAEHSQKPQYFVGINNLELHTLPLNSSKVIKRLGLNDRIEKLADHQGEWSRIRQVNTGAEGWVKARYLAEAQVKPPKQVVRKKKKAAKIPARKPPGPGPIQEREARLEPEVM